MDFFTTENTESTELKKAMRHFSFPHLCVLCDLCGAIICGQDL